MKKLDEKFLEYTYSKIKDKTLDVCIVHKNIDGINYIYQNRVWYKLTDNYINTLNEIFEMIKVNYQENDIEFEEWKDETETQYIDKYKNKKNFYKIHPRLEDEIEVCDLMHQNY